VRLRGWRGQAPNKVLSRQHLEEISH